MTNLNFENACRLKGLTFIEFYASWCPHCNAMIPIIERVKDVVRGQAHVFQYDIDIYPRDAELANAVTVPTFIIYKDGIELWRHTGELPLHSILAIIDRKLEE
jgi:thioredoxin 1